MTTWQPDTCSCTIDLDNLVIVQACERHQDAAAQDVIDENRQANSMGTDEETQAIKADMAAGRMETFNALMLNRRVGVPQGEGVP